MGENINLNKEQFEAFKLEISTFGNIPISSVNCGIGCIFCKVSLDPYLKRFPSIPSINTTTLYEGFKYLNPNVKYVRLGAGVLVAPHTDPYLHPQIYEFIKNTSDYFPNKMTTTVTTGSYIDENKLDFLNSLPNFGIDLSLITMQEQRETIVPRATRERIEVLLRHAPLNKITLMFTGSLDELKRDLDKLYSLGWDKRAKEILVRRIEYTGYSHNKLNSISEKSIAGYEDCVRWLHENYSKVQYTVPHLRDVYKGGTDGYFDEADKRIEKQKLFIDKFPDKFINLICSESGYEYFTDAYKDYENVKVNMIRNHLYGGSVTVAGLLNHRDIKEQFHPDRNHIMILPFEMYNSDDCDLEDCHISELGSYYHCKAFMI